MLAPTPQFAARQRLISALRQNPGSQCRNHLGVWKAASGPVCFMGMAFRLWGQDLKAAGIDHPVFRVHPGGTYHYECGAYFGFSEKEVHELMSANDRGHSFHRLADKIEAMPIAVTEYKRAIEPTEAHLWPFEKEKPQCTLYLWS